MSLCPQPSGLFDRRRVADAVFATLTGLMSGFLPIAEDSTEAYITPHVLGFIPVMSTRHIEHTWAQRACLRLHQPGAVRLHGRENMWAKNSWEPRSDKPLSVPEWVPSSFSKEKDLKDKPDFAGRV